MREMGQVGLEEIGARIRIAVPRRDRHARKLEDPLRPAPGHEPEERLGGQDQREVEVRGAVVARARELVAFARVQGYRPDELVKIIEEIG